MQRVSSAYTKRTDGQVRPLHEQKEAYRGKEYADAARSNDAPNSVHSEDFGGAPR